jgi:hypothetical protein
MPLTFVDAHWIHYFELLAPWVIGVVALLTIAFWIPKIPTVFRCIDEYRSSTGAAGRVPIYVHFGYMCVREFASFWHQYEVHGLHHLEKSRDNCVLVGYHSRPTLDIIYAQSFLFPISSLVSYIFFSIPFAAGPLRASNCIPSSTSTQPSDQSFINAVVGKEIPLLLCPGGAYECVKKWEMKYRVDWKERPGFIRVLYGTPAAEEPDTPIATARASPAKRRRRSSVPAAKSNGKSRARSASPRRRRAPARGAPATRRPRVVGEKTKIVPFFTHNCEEIFWNVQWMYDLTSDAMRWVLVVLKRRNGSALLKTALMPLVAPLLAVSLGFALLPLPVKLDLHIGHPLTIRSTESEAAFAKRVTAAMQNLIDTAIQEHRGRDCVSEGWTRICRHPFYVLYALLQNICIFMGLAVTILLPFAAVLVPIWVLVLSAYPHLLV